MEHFSARVIEEEGVEHFSAPRTRRGTKYSPYGMKMIEEEGVEHFSAPVIEEEGVEHFSARVIEEEGVEHFSAPLTRRGTKYSPYGMKM